MNGFKNSSDVTFPRDKNGIYHFRGLSSYDKANLYSDVIRAAQNIACRTAVYNDLQVKQKGGETLTAGEQKFMSDYLKMLQKCGLRINDKGELEDM